MDIIQAPYIKADETLVSAVERLSKIKSPLLVVWDGEKNSLYTSRTVFRSVGHEKEKKTCKQLDSQQAFRLVDFGSQNIFVPDVNDTSYVHKNALKFEEILDHANLRYGVAYVSGEEKGSGIVLVVSRHEFDMQNVKGTNVICVCTGDDHHVVEGKLDLDKQSCEDCNGFYQCTFTK